LLSDKEVGLITYLDWWTDCATSGFPLKDNTSWAKPSGKILGTREVTKEWCGRLGINNPKNVPLVGVSKAI
jgi:hypothetical protein